MSDVIAALARRLRCREEELSDVRLVRRSVDARRRRDCPRFVLSADVEYTGSVTPPLSRGLVEHVVAEDHPRSLRRVLPRTPQPVVVGMGPAGLMAALTLAEAGAQPLLLERGDAVHDRRRLVQSFWRDGVLDPESNVLFGEGGAGLFSDGKLMSRSKDRGAIRRLFQILVDCGAPGDILLEAEPHLGTDVLQRIIPGLRERLLALGGEIRYRAPLVGLHQEKGALRGILAGGKEIQCDLCLLATGHSARSIYRMLVSEGVSLVAKAFALGLRAEIPQSRIDAAQYGRWATHPRLKHASFRLTRRPESGARACYSFCMCPGGVVMACASCEGRVTTNGMSDSNRSKPYGNAAFLVPVRPSDFALHGANEPLAGVVHQEALEATAFDAVGRTYALPAQTLLDFLEGRVSRGLPERRSCESAVPADLSALMPSQITITLRRALPKMLAELDGLCAEEVLLYGPETRSSSPVRVLRDPETYHSTGVHGLVPIGEGSGYAGGIVSSALDGMAAAEAILRTAGKRVH